jgi:glycosyltransferase involved in cell wall biosynthesis
MYALSPRRPHGKSVVEDIFNRTVFATVMEMCDAVIAPGKNAVKYAEKFMLARRPSYVIPNGVEVKKYLAGLDRKREFRQKYGLPETSRIVLFAGRLTYGKGVPELLEAIRYFGNEGPKTTFVLAGDGPLEPTVREMSKHLENLISLGWVPQDRIHEVFAASDVFVLPSRWEIQSVSLIEAMASHLRVVATPVGDVPSVLEGYPRKNFIRGFKAIDIVEAIRQAISCPDNSEGLDPQVVEHVRNFDWDVVVRSYERIYLRLIQSHKGRERQNYLENSL